MLAYGLAFGCRRLELAYPLTDELAQREAPPRIEFALDTPGLEGLIVHIRRISLL
jgi:hypothetical protein